MTTITIRIGNEARKLEDASKDWINQQINRRRADNENVCVQVTISGPSVQMTLSTPTCQGRGGSWNPNETEAAVLQLWVKRGLSDVNFTGGNLIAFLEQVQRLF